jgi:thiol-disulfide isomerase/thioredoxin
VPSIAGMWVIPTDSPKWEKAWRFIVRQTGSEVSAAVLRIDGDTGALTGTYKDGKFVLSHFDSARPMLMEVTPQKDGTLELLENAKTQRTAVRWEVAHAKGLPEPTDPMKHTSVKDPNEAFQFRFPDLNGRTVSNADSKYRGKVVLVNITGSWCPNCHDEAPFLSELYKKYRDQGLEIVALSFEEADQLKDLARLRAFIKRYDIQYTVLVGGEPSEAKDKLTQAVNWNSWPTTFFIGRDGLVRGVHAGFPSSASGDLYRQAKDEFTAEVQHLLRENQRTSR